MRFKPGQSGNPAGRPPGSRNKRTIATEQLLGPNGEQVAQLVLMQSRPAPQEIGDRGGAKPNGGP